MTPQPLIAEIEATRAALRKAIDVADRHYDRHAIRPVRSRLEACLVDLAAAEETLDHLCDDRLDTSKDPLIF